MAVWSESTLIDALMNRRIDSEFFRPTHLYAEQQTRKCNTEDLGRLGRFIPGPFGSAFHVKNYDFQSRYRYLRGRDIKPFFILDDDNRYIQEEDFKRLQDYEIQPNDLMISVVGTLGNVAICTPSESPAIFSCKSTLFRSYGIDPYYLLAYLNCNQGQLCLLRRQRGAVQTGLNIEDLRSLPIPRFKNQIESEIASRIQLSHKALCDSKKQYAKAQHLLESELGLDKLSFQKPMGYTARFSELEQSRRSDSEFFNPELRYFWKNLSNRFELIAISKVASVLKFSNPTYGISGIPIVTQKHLLSISPAGYGNDLLTTDSWQRSNCGAVLQQNDLLFYSVGAYLGKTNIWLNSDKAVPASFITLLRCHNEKDAGFLQVLLNSRYGILQSKCFQSGTSQQYIYPKDIRKFLVPVVDEKLKKKLQLLVVESYEKGLEAKKLLNQAKTRVEQLIEEAVQS
ncbi:MAG: hypothetical protein KKC23_09410 [Proteobacteria bacterium]|nr:hypothetical protein [Pseudomonadota bacterium]